MDVWVDVDLDSGKVTCLVLKNQPLWELFCIRGAGGWARACSRLDEPEIYLSYNYKFSY